MVDQKKKVVITYFVMNLFFFQILYQSEKKNYLKRKSIFFSKEKENLFAIYCNLFFNKKTISKIKISLNI